MKTHLMIAVLAGLAVATPAFAKDCGKLREAGLAGLRSANAINQEIAGLDTSDPDYAQKKKGLRDKFREIRNEFYVAQVEYGSPPPCGSGDLEDDLGTSFPPMGIL